MATAIEHKSVLEPLDHLREAGFEVELLPVTAGGFVEPSTVQDRLRPDTLLVSVIGFAVLLACLIVFRTSREVGRPLRSLVRHAMQLSRGNLLNRTATPGMPGEFRTLAEANLYLQMRFSPSRAWRARSRWKWSRWLMS